MRILLPALLAVALAACTGAPPKDDEATIEKPRAQKDAEGSEAAQADKGEPERADPPATTPPKEVSVVVEVTADSISVDGDVILSLDKGFIRRTDFRSSSSYFVQGLLEPVDGALLVYRRRRLIEAKPVHEGHVLVTVGEDVHTDTILAIYHTLGTRDFRWISLQLGDAAPVAWRLSADYVGTPSVSWSARRRTREKRAQKKALLGKLKTTKSAAELSNVFGKDSTKSSKWGYGLRGMGSTKSYRRRKQKNGKLKIYRGTKSSASKKSVLGSIGSVGVQGGSAKGIGGLGFRGVGKGGGGSSSSSMGLFNRGYFQFCDDEAHKPCTAPELTHVVVKLYPSSAHVWLTGRHGGRVKLLRRDIDVDDEGDYPIWRLYGRLTEIRDWYPEAHSILIWPHPAIDADIMGAAARLNCKLPGETYDSREKWQEARKDAGACEPIFDTMVLANGHHPPRQRNDD